MDRHTHLKKTALFILFACAIMAVFASKTPVYGKNEKPGLTIPLYRQLNECKFSMEKIPVPTGGLKFNRDNASWSLESGHIQLMEPTPDGRITGLIFEGQGRFRMTIPNWVEREQFKRYTAKKDCKEVDDFFDKLIIRTPGAVLEQLPQLRQDLKYEKNKFAEHRHKHWIKSVGVDINARVTAGLLNPGDEFLWVEMDTRKFNKLTYVFDKYRREEIKLLKFKHRLNFKEIWLSLDRDSDRDKSGFPGINRRSRFDMIALDIEADLTDAKSNLYFTEIKAAGFKTKLTVTPKEKGLRMMELSLPKARINKVLNSEGKELPFIRKQAHKDILNKERDRFTESFWVLLDKTYKKDEAFEIVVDYKLDLENYTEGDSWYPTTPDNPYKKYMIRFTAKHPAKLDIIAVGERLEETKTGKIKISTWNSRTPLEMYGFTMIHDAKVERLKIDGVPEVVVHGSSHSSTEMLKNITIDISNSLKFYQHYFAIKLPFDSIDISVINSNHGQTFRGFIHLSWQTFEEEDTGASELFRAHEAAHLIWGHMLSGKTYRDNWINESFAEYSAMLFIEAVMPKKKHYQKIVEGYILELNGSLGTIANKYSLPWQLINTKKERDRVGPIGVGYRASTAEVPYGFFVQAYHRGPLILHMIRVMLRNSTGNDVLFRSILKEFIQTFNGKKVTTSDLINLMERKTGKKWAWFFNQWVNTTVVPTYTWSYKKKGKDAKTGMYPVEIVVKQSEVPNGFGMPVPVQVHLKDKSVKQFNLTVVKETNSYNLLLPKKVKKIVFNPGHSVVAKIKKK